MVKQRRLHATLAVLAALAVTAQPVMAQPYPYDRHHRPPPRPPHHHRHRDGLSTGEIVGGALVVGAIAAVAASAANNNRTSNPPVGMAPPPPAPSSAWADPNAAPPAGGADDNDPNRDRAVESCVRQIELDGSEKIDSIDSADPTSTGFTIHGVAVGNRTFACEVDPDGSTRRTLVTGADGINRTWTGRSPVPESGPAR